MDVERFARFARLVEKVFIANVDAHGRAQLLVEVPVDILAQQARLGREAKHRSPWERDRRRLTFPTPESPMARNFKSKSLSMVVSLEQTVVVAVSPVNESVYFYARNASAHGHLFICRASVRSRRGKRKPFAVNPTAKMTHDFVSSCHRRTNDISFFFLHLVFRFVCVCVLTHCFTITPNHRVRSIQPVGTVFGPAIAREGRRRVPTGWSSMLIRRLDNALISFRCHN